MCNHRSVVFVTLQSTNVDEASFVTMIGLVARRPADIAPTCIVISLPFGPLYIDSDTVISLQPVASNDRTKTFFAHVTGRNYTSKRLLCTKVLEYHVRTCMH